MRLAWNHCCAATSCSISGSDSLKTMPCMAASIFCHCVYVDFSTWTLRKRKAIETALTSINIMVKFVTVQRLTTNNNPEMPYNVRRPIGKHNRAFRNVSADASRIRRNASPGAIVGRISISTTSHMERGFLLHSIKFMHELLEENPFFGSCGVARIWLGQGTTSSTQSFNYQASIGCSIFRNHRAIGTNISSIP